MQKVAADLVQMLGAERVLWEKEHLVTYGNGACHLCHGQKITRQPRQVLAAIPGLTLMELPESTWCCGSAEITQPEMSQSCFGARSARSKKPVPPSWRPQIPVAQSSCRPGCARRTKPAESFTPFRCWRRLIGKAGPAAAR